MGNKSLLNFDKCHHVIGLLSTRSSELWGTQNLSKIHPKGGKTTPEVGLGWIAQLIHLTAVGRIGVEEGEGWNPPCYLIIHLAVADALRASTAIGWMDLPKSRNRDELQCRRSLDKVLKWYRWIAVYPTLKKMVDGMGFAEFCSINARNLDNRLIHALVERWWPSTHTFHFPCGELGFTPLDFIMLMGISFGRGRELPFDERYSKLEEAEKMFPGITSSNMRCQRSFGTPRGLVLRQTRNGVLSYRCGAIGINGIGDGEVLDGGGGSLKDGVNGHISKGTFFGTVNAEITQETLDFFVSDAEGDPDCPSEGFFSIEQALIALREGKSVIAVDDEDEDFEGDLIMAASLVTPKAMTFVVKNGSGMICVGMKEDDLDRLKLPLMSPTGEDEDPSAPSFTIPVDAKLGVSTGVSASDRAKTVLALSSPNSRPEDFRRPGHVFPLKCRNGGVLSRAGHTEASVDLVSLAGLLPISLLSAIVDAEDGSIARLPYLRKMALKYELPIVLIADLIRYRRKREKLVERTAVSRLPTKWGLFQAYCYRSMLDGADHMAVVKGSVGDGQDILVRVHSECLTGDIFGSARCDCGSQLALAMQVIEQAGRGVVVYLRGHEGRGIGLGHKLRAYNLQDQGHDTVEANLELGFASDAREYGIGAQILRDIGVRTMRLMTNNPAKFTGLKGYGLAVVGRVPVISPITEENKRYLETKRTKMGHVYGSDLPGSLTGYPDHSADQVKQKEQSD
ncbi:hypothetical protein GIB67_014191 [Kingdonia uniflora]|uniref:GTP cyclohydrolase II n=1 Tax=Kingdonia uniflora TaxID=39325 RepID=A0A7J7M1Z1_9MAGN|nr:hypothetical protein GIB67_014191 [Kingdonia uniflora]